MRVIVGLSQALAPLALTEPGQILLISSSYPVLDNYSYVELQCLDNSSQTQLPGASYQLNGTDITDNVEDIGLFLTLTQETEGFFTCSLMGLISINRVGLAAQPPSYSGNVTQEVELPDVDSEVVTELICDIQPGALRQRYSVDWRYYPLNSSFTYIGYTFNLTLNVTYNSSNLVYQCIVLIDHDGQGTIFIYEGRYVIIVTTISEETPGATGLSVGALIAIIIISIVPCCCLICLSCMLCFAAKCNNNSRAYTRLDDDPNEANGSDPDCRQEHTDTQNTLSDDDQPAYNLLPLQSVQSNVSVQLSPIEIEIDDSSTVTPCIEIGTRPDVSSWTIGEEELAPSPCSGLVIDPYNTQSYLPTWFTPVTSHLECTHHGMSYHDENNDFKLEIPEGAIAEGVTLSIDIGVALYGPFQFPQDVRPVSPVFWVCVRQLQFSQFLKPVIVTLPHFLSLKDQDDIKALGLTFLKAKHERNPHQMYEFHQAGGTVYFEPLKKCGVFKTTHLCSLCISCKDTMETIKKANFCISAIIPQTIASSYADFYLTFLLKTCLSKLNEQLQGSKRESQEFQFRGEDQALEIILPESAAQGEWTFGYRFKKKISVSDIDFFARDADDIKEALLKTKEENGMYPPRFRVVIGCFPPASPILARFQFIGATEELVFDEVLRPQPSSPPYASGTSPHFSVLNDQECTALGSTASAGSSGFGQDELAITDLFDAISKLTPVAGKWKNIGLALGLDYHQLCRIETSQSDTNDCLTEMLSLWLHRTYDTNKYGEPTWQKLSDAVHHPAGGNNPSVADNVFVQDLYF